MCVRSTPSYRVPGYGLTTGLHERVDAPSAVAVVTEVTVQSAITIALRLVFIRGSMAFAPWERATRPRSITHLAAACARTRTRRDPASLMAVFAPALLRSVGRDEQWCAQHPRTLFLPATASARTNPPARKKVTNSVARRPRRSMTSPPPQIAPAGSFPSFTAASSYDVPTRVPRAVRHCRQFVVKFASIRRAPKKYVDDLPRPQA